MHKHRPNNNNQTVGFKMKYSLSAPCEVHARGVMAKALCSTFLTLVLAPAATAQTAQVPCDPATEFCVADETVDLVLQTVEVTAAAPAPAPQPTAPRPAAQTTVAAPVVTEAPAAPSVPSDSRFALRPTRVQDRTEVGRQTVDTPTAGTVIDQAELQRISSTSAETDLLLRVPGISMIRNIRIPIGGKAYTNNLVDGFTVRSQTQGAFGFLDEVNLWDAEAVEITRGPASVLYPSKAVGGTINIISREPSEEFEGQISTEVGSYGLTRAALNLAGPVGTSEVLSYSFSANALDSEGWRDRSAIERRALSAKLQWQVTPSTTLTFKAEQLSYYQEHAGRLTESQFEDDWTQAQYSNLYEDYDTTSFSSTLEHDFGAGRKLELSYGYSNIQGTDACPSGCSSTIASMRQQEFEDENHNLRLLYTQDFAAMDGRLSLGVDAFKGLSDSVTYRRSINGFSTYRNDADNDSLIDETSIAPFAQYEFSPAEDFRVSLGARWENYEIDVDDRSTYDLDGSKSYSDLVKKAGVTWEYEPNQILWASVSEGFYVPSTSATVTTANATDLPAEESLTWSAGIRGEMAGGRLGYDVGIFHTEIRGMAVSLACGGDAVICPGDPTGTYSAAAGEVRYQGLEAELRWRASDKVRLDASYTYAHNTYVDFVSTSGDFTGNTASASPDHHVNLRVSYMPTEQWSFEAEADWISSYYTNESNTDSYERPVLFNLRAQHSLNDRVSLSLAVENVLNEKYSKRVSSTEAAVPVRSYNEGYSGRTIRFGVNIAL